MARAVPLRRARQAAASVLASLSLILLRAPHAAPSDSSWLDGPQTCGAACVYLGDGECDDGGPGSEYQSCPCGTDCSGVAAVVFP